MNRDQKTDMQGRAYARVAKLKAGDKVQVDGDFTCMPADAIRTVSKDSSGLYILCRSGHHYLDGQHSDDCKTYVGVYPV